MYNSREKFICHKRLLAYLCEPCGSMYVQKNIEREKTSSSKMNNEPCVQLILIQENENKIKSWKKKDIEKPVKRERKKRDYLREFLC